MLKTTSILSLLLTPFLLAEPITTSWFTAKSGQYAKLYETREDQDAFNEVTTWSRGAGTQSRPTYAGVHEISANSTDLYIRTSGLAFHIMGPWYNGANLFPNYPSNRAAIFRFPRTPDTSISPKAATGLGTIGLFVNGVSMFDSRDAFSYDTSLGVDEGPGNQATVNGDEVWNRDAFVNESNTFDPAFAHQAGNNYHYHANAPGLRHALGDSVTYDYDANTYSENFNNEHSPIIGWVEDGLPLYGPYAYSDPLDPASPVRRMISGYQKRDGSNGSTNLASLGRTSLPQWVVRNDAGTSTPALEANRYGPNVSENFPLGHYIEDYAYKGDLSGFVLYEGPATNGPYTEGTHFDLNEYNARWCLTPEFPSGTWAYFSNIEPDGTPVYPYNLARYYYGDPSGGGTNTIPADASKLWEGGPEAPLDLQKISVSEASGDVTLTWSTVEGGQYTIESSDLTNPWTPLAAPLAAGPNTTITDPGRANANSAHFYQARFNYLAPFDDTGFDYDNSIVSEGPQHNVLLLILDDWGIDASSLYNAPGPGIQLANMPHLESLASAGLLFTRGYAQPICSPTRATILTGRQPHQHGVGNPQADSTLPSSELTFPEIMATEAPAYGLASFGKWHLGSGTSGPTDTGGWPNFTGTLTGAVTDYAAWTRVKIENGITTDSGTDIATLVPGIYSTTYATSVQVDEAVSFITAQGPDPWVVWMGFNAPHDPFHDPAPYVTPTAGYSTSGTTNKDYYIKMLEALDHEIGRLLASVDLATTNIIVVGDNGTPGQVDQAPSGGIAGAKGSLNEGGIHVPFFAAGPDVTVTGTTDKMVHVVDLFATILELANVNVATATAGIDIQSRSIVPIFRGNDMEDRCIIAEKFGLNPASDGRALMMDDWPDYKLVSIQDVTDPDDLPSYQMYELGTNGVESSTLSTPPNPGDPHEAAYNTLVAKDQSLVPVAANGDLLYLQLPTITGQAGVPPNLNLDPTDITVDGVTATFLERVDQTDTAAQFWVKCAMPSTSSPPYATAIVTFPDNPVNPTGSPRVFTAEAIFVAP